MSSLRSITPYFIKYKWHLLSGILFVSLSTIFATYQGEIVQDATNVIIEGIDQQQSFHAQQFIEFGLILLGLALISGIFMFLMRQTIIVMSRHIEFDQKNELYAHYQTMDSAFFKQNKIGDLMSRISEDVGKVRMYTGPAIMYLANTIVTVIIIVSFMLKTSWELTLLVFAPLPFLSFVIYKVSDLINKRSKTVQEKLSLITSHTQETFSAIRVIKAYNREDFYINQLEKNNSDLKQSSLKLSFTEALFQPVMVLMVGLSVIATVWLGGHLVMDHKIEPGNITKFILFVFRLTWPFASLGWVTSLIQRAKASQTRINEFLNTYPNIISPVNGIKKMEGEIEFKNVSFSYPDNGVEAIKNLSFKIKKGEILGISGQVGTGKTTIAELILRLQDPSSGEILIDGKNIKEYDLQFLRKSIAYVPQDVFLFSDTIRNNIAFSSENKFNEEDIIEASKLAGVYDNIMSFPDGFNTIIGERGVTLSGGQKQRISIARAILSKPKMMIFDDCLSAVDAETEEQILNHLKNIMKDKTCIIISHRESAFRYCSQILQL